MKRLLYAHRGACAELPENTLEAFALALELGADAIETDVHLTRDGHVVVFHDDTGARVAAMSARVRDCTLAELRTWDLGKVRGLPVHHIPTFDEALARFPDTFFNVDAKVPAVIDPLLAVIERHHAAHRVRLASFSARNLRKIRRLGYRGETGLGDDEVVRFLVQPRVLPLPGDALQIPTAFGPLRLDNRRTIDRVHAFGKRVDFWVIDDAAEAQRLFDLGADGVMTNDPRALREVRR